MGSEVEANEPFECRGPEGEAVSFIEAATLSLRYAERLFNNGEAYGEASKDFIQDPQVFHFIARCFARRYHNCSDEKERALVRILLEDTARG